MTVPDVADSHEWLEAICDTPFELLVIRGPHYMRSTSFSNGHFDHGWLCAFKGAGYNQLPSRRWLDYGPWRAKLMPDDITIVEFHDLEADFGTALKQALPGHKRMGISDSGGFMHGSYVYVHELDGVYKPDEKRLLVPAAAREVSQTEMRDACALRQARANDPETPLQHVGFVFPLDESEARSHLHELWLRELECWTIIEGKEVRLDDSYEPPAPTKPDWV